MPGSLKIIVISTSGLCNGLESNFDKNTIITQIKLSLVIKNKIVTNKLVVWKMVFKNRKAFDFIIADFVLSYHVLVAINLGTKPFCRKRFQPTVYAHS
jgi:hypothetical protein